MPPAIVGAIIAAAATATMGGLEMAQVGTGSPMKAQEALARQQQTAAQQQSQLTAQENVKGAAANLQGQTGGNVTNAQFANLIKAMTGYSGTIPGIQQSVFGTPTGSGLASSDQPGGLPVGQQGLAH